ncbi:TPA: receptor-recognizing protein [Enterobacter hormaechei]|uniref:receptor-recognizing protein n=1 Tax=Enterobacter cloacae TaxID=550 RepID=UPI0024688EAA|nr:receptor-recognizing protein [Enterobacter cloacae]WGL80931.1 receptor-recognizing protein [Enterobacter cloacae]
MAIVGVPGWIGSSAVTETGQRWMSAARTAVFLTNPGFMSAMAGKSKEVNTSLTIGANNAYANATLITAANAIANRSITNLTITVTGIVVSNTTGAPCLNFSAAPFNEFKSVKLIINSGAGVYGRGGTGGASTASNNVKAGGAGGVAITNSIGTKLQITNSGTIAGGGGGGGGGVVRQVITNGQTILTFLGGAGGRPLGAGGASQSGAIVGASGTVAAPGAGNAGSGAGGNLGSAGAAGGNGGGAGGAAGAALNGSAPTWAALGTINGSRL